MRRFLVGGAVSASALLAACAGGDDEAKATKGANTLTLLSPGGAQISTTLLQIVDPAPFERRFAPAMGSRVVAVRLRLENTGDQDYTDTPGSGAALLTRDGAAFGTGVTPTKGAKTSAAPFSGRETGRAAVSRSTSQRDGSSLLHAG